MAPRYLPVGILGSHSRRLDNQLFAQLQEEEEERIEALPDGFDDETDADAPAVWSDNKLTSVEWESENSSYAGVEGAAG